jgi:FSR family fosmidomycin resistance protein-like MFS transporter
VSRRKPKQALATCCTAHVVHDGFSDVTYVLLPLFAQTFGLSLAQVGLIRSAHRVAMATFQIPAGLIAERFGARKLLALGTLVAGIAFIALGFAPGFWAILAALFFAGVGSAVQHPLSSTLISHAYPGEGRRTALGIYNFSGDVGKFAFGGVVSLCVLAGVSWQAPVIAFGVAGIAAAALVLLAVSDSRPHGEPSSRETPAEGGWGIRYKPAFAALCALDAVDSFTRTGFLTFIAFLMIASGLPDGLAALAVPLVLTGGMAGKFSCGVLAERLGVLRTIILTELATAISILLMLVLPAVSAFFVLPLVGIVLQGTSSVIYGTIGDLVAPDRLPRAFGMVYTTGACCGIVAPLAYGLLGDAIGIEYTIAVIGVVALLSLPLCLVLRPSLGLPGSAGA